MKILTDNELFLILISVTIFFIVIGLSIVLFVVYYYKKRTEYLIEKKEIVENFNQTLLQSQLEIQEQTLKNISEEIHDNIGQVLSLAKLHLGTMNISNPVTLEEKIQDSKYLVAKAIQDLRNLSHSLNTDYINEMGLPGAIEYELGMIGKSGLYETSFSMGGELHKLDKQKELILFRIVQEVLNNIINHAKAKRITVSLDYRHEQAELIITDDGEGFDLTPLNERENGKPGLGIKNMHNRARLIHAEFNIQSTRTKGTTVTITIPYSQTKPEQYE